MKGQFWSVDFVVSAIIFFTVLFLMMFVWNYTNIQGSETLIIKRIEAAAIQTSDSIIRTRGIPDDWNLGNVRVIGIVDEENILNETKVLRLVNLPYTQARILLTGQYNFHFELLQVNGTLINEAGTDLESGLDPLNANIVVPIERYVLYKNNITRMRLVLWV